MDHISKVLDKICRQDITPIKTGVLCLDDIIGGYYPGEMTTICGEEGCCKTAFVIHQLCHIAIDQKIPTLILLNYISERNLISSMIAYYCNIETNNIRNILDDEEYKEIVDAFLNKLRESPLYFAKAGWYEDKAITEKIDRIVETNRIKIMFVDEVIYDLTSEDISDMSCMKEIAVKRNIPVVVTCCVWNDRTDFDGVRPSLVDLGKHSYLHGHDVVIGFTNYEEHGIKTDVRGASINGMIGIEILKH